MGRINGKVLVAALAVVLVAFVAGYQLRPRLTAERLLEFYAKHVAGLPSHKYPPAVQAIPGVMDTDYGKLITLHSSDDVAKRRTEAIDYIWRGRQVPYAAIRPTVVSRDESPLPLVRFLWKASIDRLVVEMPFGVTSEVFYLRPKKARSCLMLYQEGHRVSFLERTWFLDRLLDEGCSVLALSFPLTGAENSRPTIDHPRFGRILLNDPDDLRFLDGPYESFLYYFIAPMVAALNHALSEGTFERVGATGFSGGGWAVEVFAALDPRIHASYAIAGSAPIAVHAARPESGS